MVTMIRFLINNVLEDKYNFDLSFLIIFMLLVAVIWTYYTLVKHFIKFYKRYIADASGIIGKVFKETDLFDKTAAA